jgi:RecA-family ATPase
VTESLGRVVNIDPPLAAVFKGSALAGRSIPPRIFHVPDLLPATTVTLLSGDGGTGKSFLALQLAAATVLGKRWLGRDPRQGGVLYLSSEDDANELHRRLHDTCLFYGAGLEDLSALVLWSLAEHDAALALAMRGGGSIQTTPRWDELWALADQHRPALIVLDSLADVFGGDENVRTQARQFIGLLRALAIHTGAAVLVLAHPSLSGLTSGAGTSGSTAWSNSVRSRLYFSRPGDGIDSDPDVRVLSLKKANYSRALADQRVRRRIGGFECDDKSGATQMDVMAAQSRADQIFLDLLTAYEAQGRYVSDKHSTSYAPAVFAKDALAKGSTKAGLAAAMNRLFAANKIGVETYGPPSKQHRKLVHRSSEVAE